MRGAASTVTDKAEPPNRFASVATAVPHVPIGGTFVVPPRLRAQVIAGSGTVFINGKPAARLGDKALECADPVDTPTGNVVASGTVIIG